MFCKVDTVRYYIKLKKRDLVKDKMNKNTDTV